MLISNFRKEFLRDPTSNVYTNAFEKLNIFFQKTSILIADYHFRNYLHQIPDLLNGRQVWRFGRPNEVSRNIAKEVLCSIFGLMGWSIVLIHYPFIPKVIFNIEYNIIIC